MKPLLYGLTIVCGLGLAAPAFACTQEEAINMMTKVAAGLGDKGAQASTAEESEKIVAANQKLNEAGTALGNGDNDTACKIYQEVADEFGIAM